MATTILASYDGRHDLIFGHPIGGWIAAAVLIYLCFRFGKFW